MIPVCVTSSGRPRSVQRVQKLFPGCVWYVPADQGGEYVNSGAANVVLVKGTPPMKSKQLNRALDDHKGLPFVATADDDVQWVRDYRTDVDERPERVLSTMAERLASLSGLHLAGPAPHSRLKTLGRNAGRDSLTSEVYGPLMLHRGGCPLRFDETLPWAVDMDFNLQHFATYGGTFTDGRWYLEHATEVNPGGLVAFRKGDKSRATYRKVVGTLNRKWGFHGCAFTLDESDPPDPRYYNRIILTRLDWKRLASDWKGRNP